MRASGALPAAGIKNLGHAVLLAKALVEGTFDIPEIAMRWRRLDAIWAIGVPIPHPPVGPTVVNAGRFREAAVTQPSPAPG